MIIENKIFAKFKKGAYVHKYERQVKYYKEEYYENLEGHR